MNTCYIPYIIKVRSWISEHRGTNLPSSISNIYTFHFLLGLVYFVSAIIMSNSELAVSYASLILADADVHLTVSLQDHGLRLRLTRSSNLGGQASNPDQSSKCG